VEIKDDDQFEVTAVSVNMILKDMYASDENRLMSEDDSEIEVVSDDVTLVEERSNVRIFSPLIQSAKAKICKTLGLKSSEKSEEISSYAELTAPCKTVQITGDGNCFFRAISYVVSGSEEFFPSLRRTLISHMMRNQALFKPLVEFTPTIAHHVREKKMDRNGSWATETEIFTMAHLLKTDIYTYTKPNGSESYRWLKHSGQFVDRNLQVHTQTNIYLHHANNNHFEVVLDVTSPETKNLCMFNQKYACFKSPSFWD